MHKDSLLLITLKKTLCGVGCDQCVEEGGGTQGSESEATDSQEEAGTLVLQS